MIETVAKNAPSASNEITPKHNTIPPMIVRIVPKLVFLILEREVE